MSEGTLQESGGLELEKYRLGKRLRVLLLALFDWWTSRPAADTSIAWEDGEICKDCRR